MRTELLRFNGAVERDPATLIPEGKTRMARLFT
jgi:hypothetical protein